MTLEADVESKIILDNDDTRLDGLLLQYGAQESCLRLKVFRQWIDSPAGDGSFVAGSHRNMVLNLDECFVQTQLFKIPCDHHYALSPGLGGVMKEETKILPLSRYHVRPLDHEPCLRRMPLVAGGLVAGGLVAGGLVAMGR
jgi:hypothetical protein